MSCKTAVLLCSTASQQTQHPEADVSLRRVIFSPPSKKKGLIGCGEASCCATSHSWALRRVSLGLSCAPPPDHRPATQYRTLLAPGVKTQEWGKGGGQHLLSFSENTKSHSLRESVAPGTQCESTQRKKKKILCCCRWLSPWTTTHLPPLTPRKHSNSDV